jgi:hypothetical protein
LYKQHCDRFRNNSPILSPSNMPNSLMQFYDKSGCESALVELEGTDADGMFVNNEGIKKMSALTQARQELDQIEERFRSYRQQRVDGGYGLPNEPKELFEARVRAEAKLDVVNQEIKKLKERLQSFTDAEEKEREQKVLQFGCRGSGRLQGGILREIDFQQVTRIHGVLVITDPLSVFRGLSVIDYRQRICEPWLKATREKYATLQKKRFDEIARTGHSDIQLPSVGKKVSRSSLPGWPAGCKNFLENEQDTSHS